MKSLLRFLCCAALFSTITVAWADQTISSVQQRLQRLGYYDGTVDGEMGSQTSAAIRRYQLAERLKVTGELNPQTLKSLGISAPAASSRPITIKPSRPAPVATPVPEYVAIAAIFKGGPYITAPTEIQLATIRGAQRNLHTLGYYNGPMDGRPSPQLVAAIKAWQKSARFSQSGRFDETTLKGLNLMSN